MTLECAMLKSERSEFIRFFILRNGKTDAQTDEDKMPMTYSTVKIMNYIK